MNMVYFRYKFNSPHEPLKKIKYNKHFTIHIPNWAWETGLKVNEFNADNLTCFHERVLWKGEKVEVTSLQVES